jgi:outer membrane receptor protein involved in Fe transport
VEVDARLGVLPAAAVFTHATITDARFVSLISEEGKDLAGLPVFGVSRSNVEGGIDFGRRAVSGSLWAAYTGPFTPVGEPDMRTSAFTLVHVRAIAAVSGPWSVSFGVQNIFDKRYAEVRASGFVSPGQPRTLLMTLRHEK